MSRKKGFTLVEILIVVIILGILAAIVIPQFTEASNDARDSALVSDLQTLRSQVELYKIQHLDKYPGDDNDDAVEDLDGDFESDLLNKTNAAGNAVVADGPVIIGPYLQSFPKNPFAPALVNNIVNVAAAAVPGDNTSGWYFDISTGKISPNDDDSTTSGTAHKDL